MAQSTDALVNKAFEETYRPVRLSNRPVGTNGDQDELISDFKFFVNRGSNIVLCTPYIKSLLINPQPCNNTPTQGLVYKHLVDSGDIVDPVLQTEIIEKSYKRAYSRNVATGTTLLRNRYEFLFEFPHPLNKTKYTCLFDRVFRDILIVSDINLMNNPYLTPSTVVNIPAISVKNMVNSKVGLTAVSAVKNENQAYSEDFTIGLDYDDIKDPGQLAAVMTDVEYSLLKVNTNYRNGEKFLSNDFDTNNIKLLQKDQKVYICLKLGKLDKFFKNNNNLEKYASSLNFSSIVPNEYGNGFEYIHSVGKLENGKVIDLTQEEFCILINL